MLGKLPRTDIYRNLHHYKEAARIPGFLILSIESAVNFANCTYLNERLAVNPWTHKQMLSVSAAIPIPYFLLVSDP